MTTINPEASFDLPDEKYKLGEITDVALIDPAELGMDADLAPRAIHSVAVRDPYVENYNWHEIEEVRAAEAAIDRFARERREGLKWERRKGTAYIDENDQRQDRKRGWGDPVSRDLFFNNTLNSPAINAWRSKIPSAKALADLSDPFERPFVEDKAGNLVEMDETGRKWLTLCMDGIAIRSRGSVMATVVKEYTDQYSQSGETARQESLRWMSIACGTALPAMKAALHAAIAPDLVLVDTDKDALRATSNLAGEIGFEGQITQIGDVNIFKPEQMARLRSELATNGNRPRLIDLMGIFEYTGDNIGVDPVQFLRSNYDMLHPGGRLVFGQMRDDRPVSDFTMGVVSWPYVEMRSPRSFMEIISKAGIPTKATQLYLPKDGVYTVGVVDKPLDNENFAVQ